MPTKSKTSKKYKKIKQLKRAKSILLVALTVSVVGAVILGLSHAAGSPAGCMWDADQKVTFHDSGCEAIVQSPQGGKYYLVVDQREYEDPSRTPPCRNTSTESEISKSQYDNYKANPSSYSPKSPKSCGTPDRFTSEDCKDSSEETPPDPSAPAPSPKEESSGSCDTKPISYTKSCTDESSGDVSDCKPVKEYICGRGKKESKVTFNFGCLGSNYPGTDDVSPTEDIAFAIIRFLSFAVGIVVVLSVIIAGIRYSAAQGNPQSTGAAIGQIRAALIALIIYIFIYAIMQFLVPGGAFKGP